MEEITIEKAKRQKVCYTMPNYLSEQIKKCAMKRGMNQSYIVQLAVEDFLRKEKNAQ